MSVDNFISESSKFLKDRKDRLNNHILVLENLSTGSDDAFSQVRAKVLSGIEDIVGQISNFSDSSSAYIENVDDFIFNVSNSPSSDNDGARQSLRALSTLGSIFNSNLSSPHYLLKKTSDILHQNLLDRSSVLSDIYLDLDKIKSEISKIDDSWYSDYLVDASNALNDINNAIGHLLSVRSFVYNKNAINDGEIKLVKDNIKSAVNYLGRIHSSVSVMDLLYYTKKLNKDILSLKLIDEYVDKLLNNIKNGKTNFLNEADRGNRFLDYVRELAEEQYSRLMSIKRSIKKVILDKNASKAFSKSSEWISELSTIGSFSNEQIVDFTYNMNDSSNEDTILLDNFITNLNDSTCSIDTTVCNDLLSLHGRISQKININIDSSSLINDIDNIMNKINNDSTKTSNVIINCSNYNPTEVKSIDEFITFIDSLNLDRLKYLLISSNWSELFNLDQNKLTYSDIISSYINNFINDIDDDELRNMIHRLYYKMQSDRRINRVRSLTFELARKQAISELKSVDLRNINVMVGDLERIKKRIE